MRKTHDWLFSHEDENRIVHNVCQRCGTVMRAPLKGFTRYIVPGAEKTTTKVPPCKNV